MLVPIDRATISLVWSDGGYPAAGAYRDYHHHTVHHHNPWSNDGARATTTARAARSAREHAADFVARTLARLAPRRAAAGGEPLPAAAWSCARWTPSCSVTGGTRASRGCARWSRSARARASSCCASTTRSSGSSRCRAESLERSPGARRSEAEAAGGGRRQQLGRGRRPLDVVGPAVAEMAFAARAAELRAAAPPVARASAAAVRELLALQASDWPFMVIARDRRAVRARALRRPPRGARAGARGRRRDGGDARAALREPRRSTPTAPRAPPLRAARLRALTPSASCAGASRMRITRAGTPASDGVGGDVLGDDRARADDRVVADADAAQHARAVADPDVVADAHVALVDALQADRALDLGHAVVEVDQHHAVGEDALAPDRDVLEGRDRALLADHRLGADAHLALVHADLAAVPDPRPAADAQRGAAADLELHAGADEADAFGLQASAEAQLEPARSARAAARSRAVSMWLARMKRSSASGPPCSGAGARRGAPRAGAGRRRARGVGSVEQLHRRRIVRDRRACERPCDDARRMTDRDPRPAPARRRPPRAGARDHARRGRPPRGLGARARGLPAHRQGRGGRLHRAAGRRQVDADRRADEGAPRGRAHRRRAVDRPVLAVHARRAARRPHPPDRALPRPRRVHPLDGQPRRARRALGGGAAGGAAARRGRSRGRVRRDGRRRARRRSTSSITPTRSCSC